MNFMLKWFQTSLICISFVWEINWLWFFNKEQYKQASLKSFIFQPDVHFDWTVRYFLQILFLTPLQYKSWSQRDVS